MSQIVNDMMLRLLDAMNADDPGFAAAEDVLAADEQRIDMMQADLSEYLAECSTEMLTEHQAQEIRRLLRIVNELERISDACYSIISHYRRKRKKRRAFHENATDELTTYAMNVMDFLKLNSDYLADRLPTQDFDFAAEMEAAIKKKRKTLTKASRKTIQHGGDVRGELLYMEIIREMEHIGDYCLNISEAIREE